MGCTGGWEVAQAVCVGGVQRRCTLMTRATQDTKGLRIWIWISYGGSDTQVWVGRVQRRCTLMTRSSQDPYMDTVYGYHRGLHRGLGGAQAGVGGLSAVALRTDDSVITGAAH